MKKRQKVRRALVILSFLLFPVNIYYFSPYLVIDGAFNGIVTGSFFVFGGLFFLSLVFGRGFCHTASWMAPFMITGNRKRRFLRLPGLYLAAGPSACTHCHICTSNCPMSLDVEAMTARGSMYNDECILCGACADGCASRTIRYGFMKDPV